MSVLSRVGAVHATVGRVADHLRSPLLLAMRLYWGWQFFETGKGKLENLDRTAGFFESLSIPAPRANAMLAGSTECFGGLLLLVGLGSRIVPIPLVFTMCVAYMTAHREAVEGILDNPDKFVTQPPFLFLLTALVVLAFGPGRFSLDALLARRQPTSGNN
jgi:putative oxidoreductase